MSTSTTLTIESSLTFKDIAPILLDCVRASKAFAPYPGYPFHECIYCPGCINFG
ncbi:hypothetical protein BX666DRAFT_2007066 [Dichotomocladium elegans]|nr:hypothetical protein BX666DRAFT_2007066 [Dichotomocladium elegans]